MELSDQRTDAPVRTIDFRDEILHQLPPSINEGFNDCLMRCHKIPLKNLGYNNRFYDSPIEILRIFI